MLPNFKPRPAVIQGPKLIADAPTKTVDIAMLAFNKPREVKKVERKKERTIIGGRGCLVT